MNWPRIEGIVYSEEANPQEILGVHTTGKNVLFQMFWPGAVKVNVHFMEEKRSEAAEVVSTAKLVLPMEMADENGFFACLYQGKKPQHYEYEIIDAQGNSRMIKDAYAFAPVSLSKRMLYVLLQAFIIPFMNIWEHILVRETVLPEHSLRCGRRMRSVSVSLEILTIGTGAFIP